MKQDIHVFPVEGPYSIFEEEHVVEFLKEHDLIGCTFENMELAEKFVLELRQKHPDKNFAIYVKTAHAVPSAAGYSIMPTVER